MRKNKITGKYVIGICIAVIICFVIGSLWNLNKKSSESTSKMETDISGQENEAEGENTDSSEVNQVKETAGASQISPDGILLCETFREGDGNGFKN
ncbi:MAG: hypothetical protein LUH14_08005 [Clostridiaceae bacterium]|nr:hypothetical protein [Clostridiaceae bacterium]